jgi:diketogulonate reductase-like aldo/keto reductase
MDNGLNITLNTEARMPALGLGTWRSAPTLVAKAVEYALKAGYRHIDCAAIYRNEQEIGAVFKKVFDSGTLKREDVFITSKLWNTEHARGRVRKACEQTLADLNLKYLDLYLVHWGLAIPPNSSETGNKYGRLTEQLDANGFLLTEKIPLRETWAAMEELVAEGLVKTIGVANFTAPMLLDLLSYAKITPAVNQIEMHPYFTQQKLVDFCKYHGIALTAYSPLGSPGNFKDKGSLLDDPVIRELSLKYGKKPAQIILRWGVQRDTVVIPKSITPERINENLSIWDFELAGEDMAKVSGLDRNRRFLEPYEWWKIPYFG